MSPHKVFFVNESGNILHFIKEPSFVPRMKELICIFDEEGQYEVVQVVYKIERTKYNCWVYMKKIEIK
jgi:hypothetical protein